MLSIFRWWFWLGIRLGHKFSNLLPSSQYPWNSLFVSSSCKLVTLTEGSHYPTPFWVLSWSLGIGFVLRNNISREVQISSVLTIRKSREKYRWYFFLSEWDDYADSGIDLWLEIRPLLHDYYLCLQSVSRDGLYQAKRMQAMIVTNNPDKVIAKIHKKLHRGATMIHDAEGTYNHERKAVLITVYHTSRV